MEIKKTIEIGIVAEHQGKYWGTLYEDGQSRCEGFGPIEDAEIDEDNSCCKPTDFTWTPDKERGRFNDDFEKLKKATLRKIKKTTFYEIVET